MILLATRTAVTGRPGPTGVLAAPFVLGGQPCQDVGHGFVAMMDHRLEQFDAALIDRFFR